MMSRFLLLFTTFVVSFSNFSFAELVDLTSYARITATDTRNTFFGLWPRETEDAPYTIRDDSLDTGWKPPSCGEHVLTLNFAPLFKKPPRLASVIAYWKRAPRGSVSVRAFEYCGGKELHRGNWVDMSKPYTINPPAEAFCLELILEDAGFANLSDLSVYAEDVGKIPSIDRVEAASLSNGVRVTWELMDELTCFVEIYYVADASQPISKGVLVDMALEGGAWEGPRSAYDGFFAAVVPMACDGTRGSPHFIDLPAPDEQILKNSGVIEGFYGRPWSHVERRAMMLRLARLGLGLYIYAPKDDPLHRELWRIPYAQDAMQRFFELRRLGDVLGVTFSFGISPGLDMDLDDPSEQITLLEKLRPFAEGGFRHFTLLFDDIEWAIDEEIDANLAAKHTGLANWLKDELSEIAGEEVELFFVPTVYSTQRQNDFPFGSDYLDVLKNLDPDIEVMWTGTDTFSLTLDAQDVADVTNRIGRKPVIWDNEHATDGGDMFYGKVYLAPYMNRSADLVNAVNGIVANPMILGAPNRIVIGTYANYLKNPEVYEPNESLKESACLEGADELDDSLALRLAETFYGNAALGTGGLSFPFNPVMEADINSFRANFDGGSLIEIVEVGFNLLNVAAAMATTQSIMYHSTLDVSLVDDLWFPADRLTHEGFALLWLLDWAGSLLKGSVNQLFLNRAETYIRHSLFDRYQLSFLKVVSFWFYLKGQRPRSIGFIKPVILAPDDKPLVGEVWSYTPCSDSRTTINIHGLPGAYVSDGTIFWIPSHPGIYNAIVVVKSDSGWAWREIPLVVGYRSRGGEDKEVPESEGCGCLSF